MNVPLAFFVGGLSICLGLSVLVNVYRHWRERAVKGSKLDKFSRKKYSCTRVLSCTVNLK